MVQEIYTYIFYFPLIENIFSESPPPLWTQHVPFLLAHDVEVASCSLCLSPHPATRGQWEGKLASSELVHTLMSRAADYALKLLTLPVSVPSQWPEAVVFVCEKKSWPSPSQAVPDRPPPTVLRRAASAQWPAALAACPSVKKGLARGCLPHPLSSPRALPLFPPFSSCPGRLH